MRETTVPSSRRGAAGNPAGPRIKLSASPIFDLPDLSGLMDGVVAGTPQQARLETTYYDTRDLRLARWGLNLRHSRSEGWTLQLPDGSSGTAPARRELTITGSPRRPPQEVLLLVRAFLRGAQLEPVARLSTRCLRVALLNGGGQELAEVMTDEVSVLHGRRVAARFREVEVDLRPGGEVVLEALLQRLRVAGAGPADLTPKHVRALGPSALAEPDVAVRKLLPDAPVAEMIRNTVAAAIQLVLRHDPLVRIGGDPEDVHQARVGTRRLRSHLRTFRPLLDRAWTDSLRDELGWLAGELGLVRDREVLLMRLQQLAAGLPAADARPAAGLLGQLAASIESARVSLLQSMSSQRYFDLLDRLVAAAADPVLNEAQAERASAPAARVMPALTLKPWRDLRRAVSQLPEQPSDEELHQVRILAKRMRYAAEAAGPAVGTNAVKFAKLAAAVQTELGEHQDSITAQAWLRSVVTSRRRAFVAGELWALESARAVEARGRWREAWKRLDRRRARAWMTPRPAA